MEQKQEQKEKRESKSKKYYYKYRQKKQNRQNQKYPFQVKMVIPNAVTSGSIFCGMSSLILASNGKFRQAAWLIFFACFFDLMDGRIARKLGSSSSFGVELDSLADAISFGVAPAFLVYAAYFSDLGIIGHIVASFYALCSVLRLARFNISTNVPDGYFYGLPTPAGALTLASSLFLPLPVTPDIAMAATGIIGFLLVSNIVYANSKKMKKDNINRLAMLILFVIVGGLTYFLRSGVLFILCSFYVLTGILGIDVSSWFIKKDKGVTEESFGG
ncbi:MAG: CDP-diacylglycerol--serine O-phosphatidyltransferase [Synergistaceae bacterium]|nr:CDP-diacylglycerol--serine O-phosphatidyltransferase [Synergistaceae bacterium]